MFKTNGLTEALVPIRALLARWQEIEKAHSGRVNASAAYDTRVKEAHARFSKSQSIEDHEKLILAELARKDRAADASRAWREKFDGQLESEWMQVPGLRDKIHTAILAKIEAEKSQLEVVRQSEQKHLGSKYHDRVDESLPVKDQAGLIKRWEGQLRLLDTPMTVPDNVLMAQKYLTVCKLLLSDDEGAGKKFVHKKDGEIFELRRVDPVSDPDLTEFQHTHFLKSSVGEKSWTGTKADFEKVFEKV
jgi:hypothetical protein